MPRKILLVEPSYKNKYPPIGLMKISTYHKMLGDEVYFYKGEFLDFISEEIFLSLSKKLYARDKSVDWKSKKELIMEFVRKGSAAKYSKIMSFTTNELIGEDLKYYRKYLNKREYANRPAWDRIYITTLFTFYWSTTVDTINGFKRICKDISEVKVGGTAASLLPEEIEKETGIYPHVGLLDQPGQYDDNDIIIDELPLDYSILNETSYVYPEKDCYYAYMTRGCINNCPFCCVTQLEPEFKCYVSIKDQLEYVAKNFGEKRNLLLLDNNVLASERFDEIIDEIKECGFYKGATYTEPNKYEMLIKDLKNMKINYHGHIKNIVELYRWLQTKVGIDIKKDVQRVLEKNHLLELNLVTKKAILENDDFFAPLFYKHRNKVAKMRHVDFNQGIDARLITPEKMKRLAEIPIKPLRIAFDFWKMRPIYEKAVRLAAQHGIKDISNYLLYNYEEDPTELYFRLKLNVELCEELDINIYSFPMKYHPVKDKSYFKNRTFIGSRWNRKFIRAVQAILNSTKGKIGRGKQFFEKAFGIDEKEYERILYMPEVMIVYRFYYEEIGMTDEWWQAFSALTPEKFEQIKPIIHANEFLNVSELDLDAELISILKFYAITRYEAETAMKLRDSEM